MDRLTKTLDGAPAEGLGGGPRRRRDSDALDTRISRRDKINVPDDTEPHQREHSLLRAGFIHSGSTQPPQEVNDQAPCKHGYHPLKGHGSLLHVSTTHPLTLQKGDGAYAMPAAAAPSWEAREPFEWHGDTMK